MVMMSAKSGKLIVPSKTIPASPEPWKLCANATVHRGGRCGRDVVVRVPEPAVLQRTGDGRGGDAASHMLFRSDTLQETVERNIVH